MVLKNSFNREPTASARPGAVAILSGLFATIWIWGGLLAQEKPKPLNPAVAANVNGSPVLVREVDREGDEDREREVVICLRNIHEVDKEHRS